MIFNLKDQKANKIKYIAHLYTLYALREVQFLYRYVIGTYTLCVHLHLYIYSN